MLRFLTIHPGYTTAAAMALLGLQGTGAYASPGCDAVKGGEFSGFASPDPVGFKKKVTGFAAGDRVSLKVDCSLMCLPLERYVGSLTSGDGSLVATGPMIEYTVTGFKQDTTLTYFIMPPNAANERINIESTCTPGP